MRQVLLSIALIQILIAPPATRDVRFEVLSIQPMKGPAGASVSTNPTPNGFDARISLWQAIMVAWGPSSMVNWGSVEILNTPKWIGDFYDIKGRVSPSDLQAWQHQTKEHELLRSALRAALQERCKLIIKEQPAKGDIFALLVGKRGVRLKPASTAAPPAGIKLASGGTMVQIVDKDTQIKKFYGATIQDLADFLCIMSGRTPVRDQTGLAGRYDFTIRQTPPLPDENHVYSYAVDHLGLQVKPASESRPALVIQHIEKPSAN